MRCVHACHCARRGAQKCLFALRLRSDRQAAMHPRRTSSHTQNSACNCFLRCAPIAHVSVSQAHACVAAARAPTGPGLLSPPAQTRSDRRAPQRSNPGHGLADVHTSANGHTQTRRTHMHTHMHTRAHTDAHNQHMHANGRDAPTHSLIDKEVIRYRFICVYIPECFILVCSFN